MEGIATYKHRFTREPRGFSHEHVIPLTPAISSSETQQDLRLFVAIQEGDEDAFARFYDRHSAAVLGLCMRILRNRSDADETLLEVFQQIWNRANRFDPDRATPLAYLMTIARTRAIDHLRARNRRGRLVVVTDNDEMLEGRSLSVRSPLDLTQSSRSLK